MREDLLSPFSMSIGCAGLSGSPCEVGSPLSRFEMLNDARRKPRSEGLWVRARRKLGRAGCCRTSTSSLRSVGLMPVFVGASLLVVSGLVMPMLVVLPPESPTVSRSEDKGLISSTATTACFASAASRCGSVRLCVGRSSICLILCLKLRLSSTTRASFALAPV